MTLIGRISVAAQVDWLGLTQLVQFFRCRRSGHKWYMYSESEINLQNITN